MIIETQEKIDLICQAGDEKKADEIVVMDMQERSGMCQYFVIMGATSTVRVKSIYEHIEATLKTEGLRPRYREGVKEGVWILLDYEGVVVHVFQQETRQFYNLETLWGDAPKRAYTHKT